VSHSIRESPPGSFWANELNTLFPVSWESSLMPFKLRSDSRCGVLGLALAFLFLAGCGESDGTMKLEPEKIKKIEQGHIDAAKSGAFSDPSAKNVKKGPR
jgi:hypothetical protein